jgi:uncharacterized protein (DUF952 family)
VAPPKLYHLALAEDWDPAVADYRGSTVGRTLDEEGFVHCSTAEQVQVTADRFYSGRTDVVLLTIDPQLVDAEIRVEGGFPHVYGPLPTAAVVGTAAVPVSSEGRLELAGLVGPEPSGG